jgi:hypothetical protein
VHDSCSGIASESSVIVLADPAAACCLQDEAVRCLVEARFAALSAEEPYDTDALGSLVVLQDGDSLNDLQPLLGFSPLENRYTGAQFGDAEYSPSFELIEEHPGCFEIVFVLSDDGAGLLVFVPKAARLDPKLLALCEHYAIRAGET